MILRANCSNTICHSLSYLTSSVALHKCLRRRSEEMFSTKTNQYAVPNGSFYKRFCLQNIDIEVHFKGDLIMLVIVSFFALGLGLLLIVLMDMLIPSGIPGFFV